MGNAKTVSEHIHCLGGFNDFKMSYRARWKNDKRISLNSCWFCWMLTMTIDNDFFFAHYSESLSVGKFSPNFSFIFAQPRKCRVDDLTRKKVTPTQTSNKSSPLRPLPYSTIPVKLHERKKETFRFNF